MNHKERMVKIILGDGSPIRTLQPDRNAKCYCGSGKKAKHCHGTETRYLSTKPKEPILQKSEKDIEEEEKERFVESENLP